MISGKDLEGWITAPDPLAAMEKAQNQAYYRDRRERIATAALAGMLAHCGESSQHCGAAAAAAFAAVAYADALIAELDKEVQP
jgi:hypothetical protein